MDSRDIHLFVFSFISEILHHLFSFVDPFYLLFAVFMVCKTGSTFRIRTSNLVLGSSNKLLDYPPPSLLSLAVLLQVFSIHAQTLQMRFYHLFWGYLNFLSIDCISNPILTCVTTHPSQYSHFGNTKLIFLLDYRPTFNFIQDCITYSCAKKISFSLSGTFLTHHT